MTAKIIEMIALNGQPFFLMEDKGLQRTESPFRRGLKVLARQ